MKKIVILISFALLGLSLTAQTLSDADIKQRINAAAAAAKTVTCDFVQTKHLSLLGEAVVSRGKMAFEQTDKLRWEYLGDYHHLFILNGKKAYIKESTAPCKVVDTEKSRLFRLVTKIMSDGASGKSLDDERNFKVEIKQSPLLWSVKLTPVRGSVKSILQSIVMHYDARTVMVQKAELQEKNGDRTIIEFKNVKQNAELSDRLFVAE